MHSPKTTQEYGPPSAAGELVSDRPREYGPPSAAGELVSDRPRAAEHHGLSEPPLSTLTHNDLGLAPLTQGTQFRWPTNGHFFATDLMAHVLEQFTFLHHLRREVWEGNPVVLLKRDVFALLWASNELRCHTADAFQVALKDLFRVFLMREDEDRANIEVFQILVATVAVVLCRMGKVTLPVVQDALLWATSNRVWGKWEFERVGSEIIAAAKIGAPAKCPFYKEAKRLFSNFPRPILSATEMLEILENQRNKKPATRREEAAARRQALEALEAEMKILSKSVAAARRRQRAAASTQQLRHASVPPAPAPAASAAKIQACVRGFLARTAVKRVQAQQLVECTPAAAAAVQRAWRCHTARLVLQRLVAEREQASRLMPESVMNQTGNTSGSVGTSAGADKKKRRRKKKGEKGGASLANEPPAASSDAHVLLSTGEQLNDQQQRIIAITSAAQETDACVTIQAFVRAFLARRSAAQTRALRARAATAATAAAAAVQRAWRCYTARLVLQRLVAEKHQALVTIQTHVRGFLARRSVVRMHAVRLQMVTVAAATLQRAWRCHTARLVLQRLLEEQCNNTEGATEGEAAAPAGTGAAAEAGKKKRRRPRKRAGKKRRSKGQQQQPSEIEETGSAASQLDDRQDDATSKAAITAATTARAATLIQAWARAYTARVSTARLRMEMQARTAQQSSSAATLQRAWRCYRAHALLRKLREDRWTARVQHEEKLVHDLLHLVLLRAWKLVAVARSIRPSTVALYRRIDAASLLSRTTSEACTKVLPLLVSSCLLSGFNSRINPRVSDVFSPPQLLAVALVVLLDSGKIDLTEVKSALDMLINATAPAATSTTCELLGLLKSLPGPAYCQAQRTFASANDRRPPTNPCRDRHMDAGRASSTISSRRETGGCNRASVVQGSAPVTASPPQLPPGRTPVQARNNKEGEPIAVVTGAPTGDVGANGGKRRRKRGPRRG